MRAGGSEQMAHVIHLMVSAGVLLVPRVLHVRRALAQLHISRNVTIRLLGFANDNNPLVHEAVQSGIFGQRIHERHGFNPFVAITVAPILAMVFAGSQAGGDLQVLQHLAIAFVEQGPVDARQHLAPAEVEFFRPESFRPPDLLQRRPFHRGKRGVLKLARRASQAGD